MYKSFVTAFLALAAIVLLSGCAGSEPAVELDLKRDIAAYDGPEEEAAGAREETGGESSIPEDIKEDLYVFVCGAVEEPGVYSLEEGMRVFEAINAAGGFNSEADQRALNLAETIRDGEQIYVPTVKETREGMTAPAVGGAKAAAEPGKININTAGAAELTTINGIGESRAADIIAYREQNGPFNSIEDIMKVPGIKDGMFARIKEQITV